MNQVWILITNSEGQCVSIARQIGLGGRCNLPYAYIQKADAQAECDSRNLHGICGPVPNPNGIDGPKPESLDQKG